mgnify:CR=1 FL=1
MIKSICVLCLIIVISVFSGCTTNAPTQQPAPVIERPAAVPPQDQPAVVQPQPGAVPAPVPAPAVLNPAAQSLARQATSQYQRQDYQGAIATAERGLRIERRAADLYLVLAQSYVQLGLPDKAQMFVQQGLRFAQKGSETESGLLRVKEILDY